ncbi:hypothetical protein DPSP01_005352 [Paraphaeosphaeria sporulosa]
MPVCHVTAPGRFHKVQWLIGAGLGYSGQGKPGDCTPGPASRSLASVMVRVCPISERADRLVPPQRSTPLKLGRYTVTQTVRDTNDFHYLTWASTLIIG